MFPTVSEYDLTIQKKGSSAFKTLHNLIFIPSKTAPIKVFLSATGAYAVIFKASQNGKYWAIRCFYNIENEKTNRYKIICDYLKAINANWKTECNFLENEISVNGKSYPVLKMEWIEGTLINQFVTQNNNGSVEDFINHKRSEHILEEARASKDGKDNI